MGWFQSVTNVGILNRNLGLRRPDRQCLQSPPGAWSLLLDSTRCRRAAGYPRSQTIACRGLGRMSCADTVWRMAEDAFRIDGKNSSSTNFPRCIDLKMSATHSGRVEEIDLDKRHVEPGQGISLFIKQVIRGRPCTANPATSSCRLSRFHKSSRRCASMSKTCTTGERRSGERSGQRRLGRGKHAEDDHQGRRPGGQRGLPGFGVSAARRLSLVPAPFQMSR